MFFYGEYHNKIDEKGRMRMPPKLKEGLGSRYFIAKGKSNSLMVFSEQVADMIEEKFRSMSLVGNSAISDFTSSGFMVEEDNQGRFLLPPQLREYARIEGEAVIVGAGNKIEIWNTESRAEYNKKVSVEDVLLKLSELGL